MNGRLVYDENEHVDCYSVGDFVLSNEIRISDDVFRLIILNYIPKFEWSALELVSRQFRRVTLLAYRLLHSVNMWQFYRKNSRRESSGDSDKIEIAKSEKLLKFFFKLISWSPKLKELIGINFIITSVGFQHFTALKNFSNLDTINFEFCELEIKHLSEFLKNSKNLVTLTLDNCRFVLPEDVQVSGKTYYGNRCYVAMSKHFSLTSYEQKFVNSESYLETFSYLNNLTTLNLRGMSKFTGRFLCFVNANKLKSVDFSCTVFYTDYVCNFLKRCSSLEQLKLSANLPFLRAEFDEDRIPSFYQHNIGGINQPIFHCLPLLKNNLHTLFLHNYECCPNSENRKNVGVIVGECLGQCKNLRELCLSNNYFVTNEVVLQVVQNCRSLQVFRFEVDSSMCENRSALLQLDGLRKLKALSVCSSDYELQRNFVKSVSCLDTLESLTINGPITLPCNARCLSSLENLKKLRISGAWVTNELVQHLCPVLCPMLTILEMPCCGNITDDSSTSIALCTKLTTLNLSYSKITGVTLKTVGSKCKLLEKVDLTQQSDKRCVTYESVIVFLNRCPRITLLYVGDRVELQLKKNDAYKKFANVVFVRTSNAAFMEDKFLSPTLAH